MEESSKARENGLQNRDVAEDRRALALLRAI